MPGTPAAVGVPPAELLITVVFVVVVVVVSPPIGLTVVICVYPCGTYELVMVGDSGGPASKLLPSLVCTYFFVVTTLEVVIEAPPGDRYPLVDCVKLAPAGWAIVGVKTPPAPVVTIGSRSGDWPPDVMVVVCEVKLLKELAEYCGAC